MPCVLCRIPRSTLQTPVSLQMSATANWVYCGGTKTQQLLTFCDIEENEHLNPFLSHSVQGSFQVGIEEFERV